MKFTSDKKVKDFLEDYTNEGRGWELLNYDKMFSERVWSHDLMDPNGLRWVVLVRDRLYLTGRWLDEKPCDVKWGIPEWYVFPECEVIAVPLHEYQSRITQAIKTIRDNGLEEV